MGTAQSSLIQIGELTTLVNDAGVVQGSLTSLEDVQQYVVYVYQVTSRLVRLSAMSGVAQMGKLWNEHFLGLF